ncbi:MAG TPA: T9SS type A sorting domain-containing protein [Flavobacteriales bacterium]|nr:T9SS type A sorting domain-containing protein [Flavobacteriales bacterium]
MVSKYLPFVAVAAITLIWCISPDKNELTDVTYSPRNVENAIQRDANGAAEITRMLLADVETGEINSKGLSELREDVLKFASAQSRANSKTTDISWSEMGPDNVGGRTRAIVAVNEDLIYAGAVSGGLWRSNDGANTWNQVTGMPFFMIASIAVSDNGDIYVGTGSNFDYSGGEGNSGFRGRGIWWSNDGGETFSIVDGTDPGEFNNGNWSSNDALVKHPNYDNRVWYGSNSSFGTIENGVIDINPASGGPGGGVTDITIAPDGSYMLVAASNGRVYRSTNEQFSNFESITAGGSSNGSLPQSGIGRARIAISQDDANHAFALYSTSGGLFYGLYHSDNAGQDGSWTVCWPGGVDTSTPLPRAQGVYDLALGIKKGQPDLAYVGGISLWRSGPNQQAEPAAASFDFPGFPYGVHADLHEIIFTEEGTMFVASDGGLYKSDDGGMSYTECNNNYNVTQFYGMAHSAGTAVLGGTQDNGSLFIPGDGYFLTDEHAIEVHGGDGFDCAISQVTESPEQTYAWFAASQNGGLARGTVSPGAVSNLGDFWDNDITDLINDDGDLGQFYTCLRLYEDTEDEDSQQNIILVNPYGETVTDSTFVLHTNSQNLPLEYTLGDGEELLFYDSLVRPERLLSEILTEDPDYFWLAPQIAQEQFICWDDTLGIDTVQVIESITILYDSVYAPLIDEWLVYELDADTIFGSDILFDVVEVCDSMYFYAADTILEEPGRILVHDPYTTMLSIGFVGSQGVWMTREGLNFNTTPDWFRLGSAPVGGGAKSIEYVVNDVDHGGDVMFVSGWNATLVRFSGLKNVYSQDDVEDHVVMETLVSQAGSAITGVSVDPNNANHVVFTVGGYGNVASGKVRESWDALSESPTFTNIWSVPTLSKMPIYDVVIDFQDESGATIIIGTEYGTFITDNGGSDWTIANLGMAVTSEELTTPVFDLKQQWRSETNWSYPSNTGAIYAGSHGRGIFRSDSFLGAEEVVSTINTDSETLLIYPNPVIGSSVQINTSNFAGNTSIEVYDLQGRMVSSKILDNINSSESVLVDVSDLSNGTYVVRVASDSKVLATKLIIRR